jgi:hypothetical protein
MVAREPGARPAPSASWQFAQSSPPDDYEAQGRGHTRRVRRVLLIVVLVGVVLLSACSSDDDDNSSSTSSPSTTSSATSTAPTTTATSAPPVTTTTACTTGDHTIPTGAVTRPTIDVDGDGQPDVAWIVTGNGTTTFGIATSAGGGATVPFDSASPVMRSALVVDADGKPPAEILLDDGRSVQLYAFDACRIVPITNPQGQPYVFSLGFTEVGTGVGCADRHLVGLDAKINGSTVDWSRTVIDLDGTHAENGAITTGTYQSPADDAAIATLHTVTCGDATIANSGVTANG